MKITEYLLPDPGARPRRIDIAKDDTVYYTDYGRGYLGRLDPKTGKVEEFPSPGGAASRPYGIAISPDGAVWYCETGNDQNVLVRFHPETKKMQTWPIPGGGGVVRHMVSAANGDLWLAESGVGKIARVRVRPAAGTQ
jgi:virginiamycin B lyase